MYTRRLEETDSLDEGDSRQWPRNSHRNSLCYPSGYWNGHSPPLLSAASASADLAASKQAAALAVIRESEPIPRPIWPPLQSTPATSICCTDLERRAANVNDSAMDCGLVACGSSLSLSTDRELLLELSQTLSAVLEGGSTCNAGHEQMLRHISRSVTAIHQPRAAAGCAIYEEICSYARAASCPSNESATASTVGLVNPINSSLYQQKCSRGKKEFLCQSQLSTSSGQHSTGKSDARKRQYAPTISSLAAGNPTRSSALINDNSCASCNCNNSLGWRNIAPEKLSSKQILGKSAREQNDIRGGTENRLNYPSIIQHEYTTLDCSDSSSSEGGAVSKDNTWSKNFRGFDKNLDFTLDGLKAERLGRAIAKEKRRRRWCRVLVVIFGLVFFFLSVVVVSLSLTRGRKVFGSM